MKPLSHKWIASLSLYFACILCGSPKNLMGAEQNEVQESKQQCLKIPFDELEESIKADHGITLSLPEACEIVKNNLYLFEIPAENKEAILAVLEQSSIEDCSETSEKSPPQKST